MNTKFVSAEVVATGTMAFKFEKPTPFDFKAGQSIDLSLIDPSETDEAGNTRAFSLASAPHEEHLMIATRMRDTAFKRSLPKLESGAPGVIEGPFGYFNLHQDESRPAVLLAGGIGITPFRSIVVDAAHKMLPHKIFLFYSNRRPEDSAFLTELLELERRNPNYTFVGTMTDMKNSSEPWTGRTGYIDEAMLREHLPEGSSPVYYIAGPQAMVQAMRDMLERLKVSLDDIRTEEFSGY